MQEEKEGKKKIKEKIFLSMSRQSVWENPKILLRPLGLRK